MQQLFLQTGPVLVIIHSIRPRQKVDEKQYQSQNSLIESPKYALHFRNISLIEKKGKTRCDTGLYILNHSIPLQLAPVELLMEGKAQRNAIYKLTPNCLANKMVELWTVPVSNVKTEFLWFEIKSSSFSVGQKITRTKGQNDEKYKEVTSSKTAKNFSFYILIASSITPSIERLIQKQPLTNNSGNFE